MCIDLQEGWVSISLRDRISCRINLFLCSSLSSIVKDSITTRVGDKNRLGPLGTLKTANRDPNRDLFVIKNYNEHNSGRISKSVIVGGVIL